jgi:hypothetical protein
LKSYRSLYRRDTAQQQKCRCGKTAEARASSNPQIHSKPNVERNHAQLEPTALSVVDCHAVPLLFTNQKGKRALLPRR